jgi:hypothetical protein
MSRAVAEHVAPRNTPLYRVHYIGLELHFSTGGGRFDITDGSGFGTCYIAEEPLGAFVESLGRIKVRTKSDIAERQLSTLKFERDLRLFDVTARRNRWVYDGWDLNADIAAGDDYRRSQQFASIVAEEGLDGIYYAARHDPAHSFRSLAIFGTAGGTIESAGVSIKTDNIPEWLVQSASHEFGFQVIDEEPLP